MRNAQRWIGMLSLLLAVCAAFPAAAQMDLTESAPACVQDFDALPGLGDALWVDNATLPGWYSQRTGTGNTVVVSTGANIAGNLYSYGAATRPADRALGTIGSANATAGSFAQALRLRNAGAQAVSHLLITYAGEQWRNSAAVAQTVSFSYQVSAAGFAGGIPAGTAAAAGVPAGFTAVPALDFTSPVTGGAAGSLDGNQASNRVRIGALLAVNLPAGSEILLVWQDPDHAGSDHGLALDELAVTAVYATADDPNLAPTPAAIAFPRILPNQTALSTLTLINTGATNALMLDAATTLTGPQAGAFRFQPAPPLAIGPEGVSALTVEFDPAGASGVFRADLVLVSNDAGNTSVTVPLLGIASGLRISEIMYDPQSSEPEWEWIEVFNNGSTPVDLTGYVLDDDDGPLLVAGNVGAGIVPAGGSVVLFNSTATLSLADFRAGWNAGVNAVPVASFPEMDNAGDRIGLWPTIGTYGGRDFSQAFQDIAYEVGTDFWPRTHDSGSIFLAHVTDDNTRGLAWIATTTSLVGALTEVGSIMQSSVTSNGTPNTGGDLGSPLYSIVNDEPNVFVSPSTLDFGRVSHTGSVASTVTITNNGTAFPLHLQVGITGPQSDKFTTTTAAPAVLAPGASFRQGILFQPAGAGGTFTAYLLLATNDPSDPLTTVTLKASTVVPTGFEGLIITEVATRPTDSEFVEIYNRTGAPINLSGVVVSDAANNNAEGALKFPNGTVIGSREVLLVALGNLTGEPAWLDLLPAGVRVFSEPARLPAVWTPGNGIPVLSMNDYTQATGGTLSTIQLGTADGIALYLPAVTFSSTLGPVPPTSCIDGMNYNSADASTAPNPINPYGAKDTQFTRVGIGEPPEGSGLTRIDNGVNANSSLAFTVRTVTPGVVAPTGSAPVVEVNLPLEVGLGTSITLTAAFLRTTDAETPAPADLLYSLTAVPRNGVLLKEGIALNTGANRVFTQEDIDSGRIVFLQNGDGVIEDQFAFQVFDVDNNAVSGAFVFQVTGFTAVRQWKAFE